MTSIKQPMPCNPPPRRFKRDTDVNDTQHNIVDNTTSIVWLKLMWCCHFVQKKIMGSPQEKLNLPTNYLPTDLYM